jgi:hypothetical protein
MATRKEFEEFLHDSPREVALAFSSLLDDELQKQDSLVVVRCGGQLSLLRFPDAGDVVRFYFVQGSEREGALPRLERLQLASPRGAQVKLVGQLEAPDEASTWEDWTVRRTIVVTHDALPHGQIECDLDRLDSEKQEQVDALFNSWLKPGA